jgi:TonB-linked SusC/RagA family outer membrane protein
LDRVLKEPVRQKPPPSVPPFLNSKRLFMHRLHLSAKHLLSIFLFLTPILLLAQAGRVSGTVRSAEDNKPLSGVSVQVKGKAAGTATDETGAFSVAAQENDVLVISYIGHEAKEYVVKGSGPIEIRLSPVAETMKDVVVVGYGTQRRRDLTGAVGKVNSNDIKSLPVPNVGEALQGRVSGVQVVSSGAPGSNVTIRIRGIGTINGSDPLLVIDGVPTDIPLNAISQDDIASIEILKDASAAAIYGSRGAGGVVLITTKRGSAGQGRLEFKAFTGVQEATNMPALLNASQFAALHNEMMANNGAAQNPAFVDPQSLGVGTDWLGAMFQTAPLQNYSLAYSGGNERSNYYVSGAVLDQKGIVLNTNYRRYTIQVNGESKVFDWLKFSNNLTLNHDIKKSGSYSIRDAMAALPIQAIYNADGTYAGPVGQASWVGDIANPIGKATLNKNVTKGYNILGNLSGEVTLYPGLKFRTTGGLQASFWDDRNWSPKYNWQPIPQPNSYLYRGFNKAFTWLWDNFLTYEKRIGNIHNISVLAGSSAQANRFDYMNGSVQDFASDYTQQLNNGTQEPTLGGSASEWALLSFIGRVNYGFRDKYLVTASVRRDGSSRFGSENKYGTFPSASVAWRISQEDFFDRVSFINDLKLRAGYGITGNQNIGGYSFASVLQTAQYNFNNQPVTAVVPLMIPNPGVRWEQVEQINIGVDATFLNNRVNLTVDAYVKNTNDMLVPMVVPIPTGYSDLAVPMVNFGKVQNKGIEFALNTQNTKGALQWNTNFNVSFNRNKVVQLNDSVPMFTGSIGLNQNLATHSEGHAINTFYGFVTNGIFQDQKEVDNYAVQVPGSDPYNRTSAGDIRFRDINNDGKIDDNDRTFLGNPTPPVIFALSNSFAYKGIDLSVFLQGVSGNRIYNANRIWQEGMAVAQNQTTAVLNRWTGPGTSNTMPRTVFNDPNKNTRVSDRFVEDGSYLRIKNVTLGYTLPKSLSQKAKMSSARIYVSGQNLVTFTQYTGFDPEVSSNGIDLGTYPVTRTVSAGINLSF